ncbi:putative reverse transcriptase domain-containing protein [Tanacetum coccineum]
MQRGKVIAYSSRQLKKHEKNYTTHDLELGAVVFALKTGDIILWDEKVLIYTDQQESPVFYFDQKDLNSAPKAVGDRRCLSRTERLKPRRVRAMSITIHSGLKTKILEAQSKASKDLKALAEWLRGLETHFEANVMMAKFFFDRFLDSIGWLCKELSWM